MCFEFVYFIFIADDEVKFNLKKVYFALLVILVSVNIPVKNIQLNEFCHYL
jgi:hypothetical protein